MTEKQLLTAREEFRSFMAVETKDLKKTALKTKAAFFTQKLNTSFEELACIGYNPAFSELTATVRIKRASGYSCGASRSLLAATRFKCRGTR